MEYITFFMIRVDDISFDFVQMHLRLSVQLWPQCRLKMSQRCFYVAYPRTYLPRAWFFVN